MAIAEISLGRYQYRFRKLTYREEFGLQVKPGEDARKAILATALVDVSGLTPTFDDALKILQALSRPTQNRIWILYRARIEEDRFFSTRGLYRAPDPNKIIAIQQESEHAREQAADQLVQQMERKFGKQEVKETLAIERRMFEDARRRGAVTKATPEKKP